MEHQVKPDSINAGAEMSVEEHMSSTPVLVQGNDVNDQGQTGTQTNTRTVFDQSQSRSNGKKNSKCRPVAQDESRSKKKNKLRTSKDVYDRLKWAAGSTKIDTSSVYIGYLDRFLGMCEMSFLEYDPAVSDIPFHRIYYFRSGGPPVSPRVGEKGEVCVDESNWPEGTIVHWDRNSRTDLIFNSGDTPSPSWAPTTNKLFPGEFPARSVLQSRSVFHVPIHYSKVPSFKFNPSKQQWEAYNGDESLMQTYEKSQLKIVCFNVLFELYDPEIVQCARRWPYLIDLLEETDADIIALQEITTSFLSHLQSQQWCQKNYYLSDTAEIGSTVKPYGQLLLSKIPPAAIFFTRRCWQKRMVFASFLLNDHILHIPVIHLKSDYAKWEDCRDRRKTQLQNVIHSCLASSSGSVYPTEIVMAGDTNFTSDDETRIGDIGIELLDVWPHLMGTDPGMTFDPSTNALAAILSTHQVKRRFDRIFIKLGSTLLKPVSMKIIGTELIDLMKPSRCTIVDEDTSSFPMPDQLSFSDHFGFECEFEMSKTAHAHEQLQQTVKPVQTTSTKYLQPVYTSAIILSPPEDLWEPIQEIRTEYDPHVCRWLPHINLIYGYVKDAEGNFDEAEKILTNGLSSFQPFQCKLSKLSFFRHGKSSATVYLEPEPASNIKELQAKLQDEYKLCSEQSEKSSDGFTPHLSIAKFSIFDKKNDDMMQKKLEEWRLQFERKPIEFTVDRVYLISRIGNAPFVKRKTIHFGGPSTSSDENMEIEAVSSGIVTTPSKGDGDVETLEQFLHSKSLLPTPQHGNIRQEVIDELGKLCSNVLCSATQGTTLPENWEHCIHIIGSGALTTHNDQSDIDALCIGSTDIPHEVFFEHLEKMLKSKSSPFSRLNLQHLVLDTLVPLAKLTMGNVDIDLVYSGCSNPWELSNRQLNQLSDRDIRSVAGIRDVMQLKKLIPDTWKPSYQMAVRAVKFWAKIRNIYSKGFGYLGGYPYSLLMAYVTVSMSETRPESVAKPEELIYEFFFQFANWRWPAPVEFHESRNKNKPRAHTGIPELMPILAPAFPYNNSARNVTKSTRSLLKQEFKRGLETLSQKSNSFMDNWNMFIEKPAFFESYSTFLKIDVNGDGLKSLGICKGFLESRLVSLMVHLEKEQRAFVQPYTQIYATRRTKSGFELISNNEDSIEGSYTLTTFLGINPGNEGLDLRRATEFFKPKFESWRFKPCGSAMEIYQLSLGVPEDCDVINQYKGI